MCRTEPCVQCSNYQLQNENLIIYIGLSARCSSSYMLNNLSHRFVLYKGLVLNIIVTLHQWLRLDGNNCGVLCSSIRDSRPAFSPSGRRQAEQTNGGLHAEALLSAFQSAGFPEVFCSFSPLHLVLKLLSIMGATVMPAMRDLDLRKKALEISFSSTLKSQIVLLKCRLSSFIRGYSHVLVSVVIL